jgi:sugar phosphate isomerase/epimerase
MFKIAVAVASEKASPKAFVVFRGIRRSIIKAAKMGYDGIELALKTPKEIIGEDIKNLLKEHNLCCPAISTGQVFADLNLYLSHPSEEKRREAILLFKSFIKIAHQFDAMLNIGRARGFIGPDQTFQEVKETFLESLKPIEEHARKFKVTLILEPINRYETNFINNLDEAARLITEINSPYIKIMPDVFHMNIEEVSIEQSLEKHKNLIGYIHFADSNRYAPGMGHLNFKSIVETLKRIGYSGWISIEILPFPDPSKAALNAIKYLKPLFS